MFILLSFNFSALAGEPIKILVVDTGVSSSHPALSEVFCPDKDNLDADTGRRWLPVDTEGHGTHVAGIIRALAGSKGYCLAFCKYFYSNNEGIVNTQNTVKCLRHANAINVKYINYSSGGKSFMEEERRAVSELTGTLFVAAGNSGEDIGIEGHASYPAGYHLPNEVVVGSYDMDCNKTETSNFGDGVVFFFGGGVYSSVLHGRKQYMSGTSMATAVAMGAEIRKLLRLPEIGSCRAYEKTIRDFWTSH